LLAAMTRVALDTHGEEPLLIHPIAIRRWTIVALEGIVPAPLVTASLT